MFYYKAQCTSCLVFVESLKGCIFVTCSVPQPIILVLLDIPPMLPVLDGVVMELQDCALPLLRGQQHLLIMNKLAAHTLFSPNPRSS